MISKILGTIFTRIMIAALTLAIVLINGWFLGAEKVGTISLVVLAITLIQLVNGFVGGGAIVYLVPRSGLLSLLVPSVLWSVVTALAGSWVLQALGMIPCGFCMHVMLLSMILSLATTCYMILIGQERIRIYNIVTLLQAISLFLATIFWIFVLGRREVMSYVIALYISYVFALAGAISMVVQHGRWGDIKDMKKAVMAIFRYGSVMQAGNLLQFFNYRLSYYFTEFFSGRAALGVYSVGVQLSESIWLIGRSIHMVQYSRISNEKDAENAARLTLVLTKISFLVTFICLTLLLLVVWILFPLIFTHEFAGVWRVMAALSAGILLFSVSITLSPYFSGLGKPVHNTVSAAIGFAFTLISGLILIPPYGFVGAAFSASISYAAATLYQFIVFVRVTRTKLTAFLLTRDDLAGFSAVVREYLTKDTPGNTGGEIS